MNVKKGLAIKALNRASVKLGLLTAIVPLSDQFSREPIRVLLN